MKNIFVVTWFTLREAFARKVFIFFLGISALVILAMAIIFSLINTEVILTGMSGGKDQLFIKDIVTALEIMIVTPLATLCLLLSIFSTASFITIMLEKGNIDLLLSKPVSRTQLLFGKYFGGLLVVFLNIAFLIIGVWLIISLKFSHWDFSFLWSIIIITFIFAVLYSVIILFGIITKNSLFGMMTAYFIFLIVSPLLLAVREKLHLFIQSDFLNSVLKGLYYFFPKTSELMDYITSDIARGQNIQSYMPVWTSFLFLAFMIGLGIFIFNRKDF